ncbi:MAG: hypothetical protein EXR28_14600 [Betaproteobacteria bacterium]|nr:hypothetical protein [Betaproteobacteria bacterium]
MMRLARIAMLSGYRITGFNAILDRLSAEFVKALQSPQLQKFMAGTMVQVGSTPTEFAAVFKSKKQDAARLFKALEIRPTEAPE